ncbi:hypothetical protein ZIOFF_028266 [Zingiber officinale]|uniref:MRH domain-containing protein n=1 Tax=Zingiber officinale TaxID=94328 RepID=A0A8J5GL26_ZINOF|nr:hypothetical protein ZIOFF_028266 [Zingiber officinale]
MSNISLVHRDCRPSLSPTVVSRCRPPSAATVGRRRQLPRVTSVVVDRLRHRSSSAASGCCRRSHRQPATATTASDGGQQRRPTTAIAGCRKLQQRSAKSLPRKRREHSPAIEVVACSLMALARSLCGSILLLHLLGAVFLGSILADQIYTGSGGRFGRSSREPKYKVEFHPENSPFYPVVGQEEVAMSNKEGKNYNCYLPIVEETKVLKTVTHENSSSLIMESEQKIKFKTPDELIEDEKVHCVRARTGLLCKQICKQVCMREFTVIRDALFEEFVLGKFDADATSVFNENHSDTFTVKDPRSKDASQRYHAHQYTNGTMCDLTNQPRETEVRFVCSEQSAVISSIKEAATCKYVVTIQCSLLCKHPMFQQERPMWHTIHCNEMGGDSKDSSVEDGPKFIVELSHGEEGFEKVMAAGRPKGSSLVFASLYKVSFICGA